MSSRPKRLGHFLATDPDGKEVVIVKWAIQGDFLNPPAREWETVVEHLKTEAGVPVWQKESGVYVSSDGLVYRSKNNKSP